MQGLVPDERRGRISAFMDSYFITTSTVIGCVVLIILLALVSSEMITMQVATWIYLGFAVVTSLAGIGTSIYLRKVYDSSLLNYRLARSKRKSVLDGIEF
jgi:energy-converting hydrogenase Eha subunit C